MSFDPIFWLFAAVGLGGSISMVTQRNPVYSAVSLLVAFLSFAVIFLKLSAPFLAAIHVLVYTGAILVLFVFVIMLLNLQPEELGDEYPLNVRLACAGLCSGMFVLLAVPILREPSLYEMPVVTDEKYGSVESIGTLLFTTYALPFELVSVLIIVAMFGAMVLAKKKLWA
jgi:NADH-quinone oxidoreductase subunit J